MKTSPRVVALLGGISLPLAITSCTTSEPFIPDIETVGEGDDIPSRFFESFEGGGEESGYHVFELTRDGESYNVQTNPWGGGNQIIRAGDGNAFEVVQMIAPDGGNDWDVAAYPSVYKGTDQGGFSTQNSGMPIAISDITSVRTGLSTNTRSITFQGNTTYDVYFTHSAEFSGGPPDNFLMVWFDAEGFNPINSDEGYNCSSQAPSFVAACSDEDRIQIQGKVFYRFFGSNGHADVVSYVPTQAMDSWEFDLKYFIDDSVARGYLEPDMYLVSIQAGFEMAEGGAGLEVKDFYADVQ